MSDEVVCEWCGGEVWEDEDLTDGKCLLCIVQDCRHGNSDIASYDVVLYVNLPHIMMHHVCMDCEICWEVRHDLSEGIKSKYHHEDLNASDIND